MGARFRHVLVDEFQDLNPIDPQFVDGMVAQGAWMFVAGLVGREVAGDKPGSVARRLAAVRPPIPEPITMASKSRCSTSSVRSTCAAASIQP